MKAIKERIALEKTPNSDKTKNPLSWFPPMTEDCSVVMGNRPSSKCNTGMEDFD